MHLYAESSVDALYRTHRAELCALAQSYVGCPDTAEDLVQDVFLQLWTLGGSGCRFRDPRYYLYASVRNRALNYLAHERVMRESHATMQSAGLAPAMSQPPTPAEEIVEAAELEEAFGDAVGDLPTRCQEAYLHRTAGMTNPQIAAAMGTSIRNVEAHFTRARRFLRRDLACWL